jgi:hypothetical protein
MNKNEATASADIGDGVRIFAGKLHRTQRGHGKAFLEGPPSRPPEPVRRPARVAIMLALAHKIQSAIDRDVIRDRAEAAMRLGLSRARISQLLNLMLLPPRIQEQILFAESIDGIEPLSERALRAAVRTGSWREQPMRGSLGPPIWSSSRCWVR